MTAESPPNPLLLDVAMGLSMACGVFANLCLVLRFAERSVKKMTLLCIILLSTNGSCIPPRLSFKLTVVKIVEFINIPAVVIFALTHRPTEEFVYGQSFWLTVCSMIVSTTTNITLIIDYSHTKDFAKSGTLTYY